MAQTAVIKIKVRSGTLFQWTAANPVLLEGEIGYVTDGPFFIIGNGTSPFLALSPIQPGLTSINRYRPEAYIVQNLLNPLQNSLEAQITNANNLRAQGDANLQTQINGLQSTVVTIQTNLTAANQARIDGDVLLQTNIDTVNNSLYALEANIKNWYGNGQSNGDLLVYSADNGEFLVLPVGSAGQVLTAGASGNYPSWETPAGGGSGDMATAVYDPDLDGIVEAAEREQIQVINKTGSTLTKGTIVYIKTGSSSANYPEVLKANAGTELTSSKTIGAVYEDIANDQTGYIVTSGQVHNLNTAAYQVGQKLWLSTVDGQVTTTPPTQPNHTVFIGHVTRSQSNNGRVLYAIQNGYELNELHDVLINSPANDQALVYESATGLWKNKTIATGGANTNLLMAYVAAY